MTRLAYAYVRVLFILETMLFTGSLLLQASVIAGGKEAGAEYGPILFRGTIIVGVAATAFIKDGLKWIDQIKSCPPWMWKGALILGVYGLLLLCLPAIFPAGPSLPDETLTVSGVPLGFDAIYICILCSVLWSAYLDKSEVIKRVQKSIIVVAFGAVAFLPYRAGYLPRPNTHKGG